MKDFTLSAMWIILQEALGAWFWPALIALALFVAVAVFALIQKKLRLSDLLGVPLLTGVPVGIITALITPMMTGAQFSDLQNSLDYSVLVLVALGTSAAVASVWWVISAVFSRQRLPLP